MLEVIGQKFIAAAAQGKLPPGGQPLQSFSERAADEVDEARLSFDSVQMMDNGSQDADPRPGRIAVYLDDSDDGGYRAHQYEVEFQGTADRGSMLELRHFPASDKGPAIVDASWTAVDGDKMTNATYLQDGDLDRVQFASVNHVDAVHPENGKAVGWRSGFHVCDVATVKNWHLLP